MLNHKLISIAVGCFVIAMSGLSLVLTFAASAQRSSQIADPLSNRSPAQQERDKLSVSRRGMRNASAPPPGGIAGAPANDDCENAILAFDGKNPFSTIGATTDGPAHPECLNFGGDQVNQDIWFDYVATVTDTYGFSLCGSSFDTKLALYEGCTCPASDANLIGCNDDECDLQSQLLVPIIAGNCYKIRVGGYTSASGTGILICSFIDPPQFCGSAGHDCCATGGPGCDDARCCELICAQDPFCCEVAWDTICVSEASSCPGPGCIWPCIEDNPHDCFTIGGPGCNDVACCDVICGQDPFCCNTAWDGICVSEASILCIDRTCVYCPPGAVMEAEPCGEDTNSGCGSIAACDGPFPDCCVASSIGKPGCSDPACEASICAADPFCCETSWDGICAAAACADANCQCEPGDSPFQVLKCGQAMCGSFWSSTSFRDTDWFRFTVDGCETDVTWTVGADFPPAIFILNGECPATPIAAGVGNCPAVATAELMAGDYTLFVAPAAFVDFPCGGDNNDYVATLTCEIPCAADIDGPSGGPNGVVDVDDLLKVINNWGTCK